MKNSFPKSENEINLSGLAKSEKIAKEAPFNDGDAERKCYAAIKKGISIRMERLERKA